MSDTQKFLSNFLPEFFPPKKTIPPTPFQVKWMFPYIRSVKHTDIVVVFLTIFNIFCGDFLQSAVISKTELPKTFFNVYRFILHL